jgi:hypothetical protein
MRLLRIEGVNLAHCVDDTQDLSTRRGGSYILLDAIQQVCEHFNAQLKPISTGASIGLFEITDTNLTVHQAITKVFNFLSKSQKYMTCTFVVNAAEGNATAFRATLESVIASNRWAQQQSLSFSTLGLTVGKAICSVDKLRPAQGETTAKGESLSVASRRKEGLALKRNFFSKLVDSSQPWFKEVALCNDFESLCKPLPENITPATLEGKLAIFYADGNKFSNIVRSIKAPENLSDFDRTIKSDRRSFLVKLLSATLDQPRWHTSGKEGALRLEILLWGGDELMIAVPAWLGLELASLFFSELEGKTYPREGGQTLTHAAALVLCHHNAPITTISKLAKNLAEQGKTDKPGQDSLTWTVLESFDGLGDNIQTALTRRFPKEAGKQSLVQWREMMLSPHALALLERDLPSLKEVIPKSQLVRIVRLLSAGFAQLNNPLLINSYAFMQKRLSEAPGASSTFETLWSEISVRSQFSNKPELEHLPIWVTLLDLWDYATPKVSVPEAVPQ